MSKRGKEAASTRDRRRCPAPPPRLGLPALLRRLARTTCGAASSTPAATSPPRASAPSCSTSPSPTHPLFTTGFTATTPGAPTAEPEVAQTVQEMEREEQQLHVMVCPSSCLLSALLLLAFPYGGSVSFIFGIERRTQ